MVSVCMPVFNAEKYVGQTINSLLNQQYQNLEIIIVDDGSKDQTLSILEDVSDARFQYFEQKNKGAASARNTAFQKSKGQYIKFVDADDLLNPLFITEQVSRLANQHNCIASAKWGRFYNDDETTFSFSPEKVWKDMNALDWLIDSLIDSGGNMMQPGLFLIPRNIIENVGLWNEELSLIDDFEFMCRVMANTDRVLFCSNAVLKYRSGNHMSLSYKQGEKYMRSAFRSLELGLGKLLEKSNSERARLAAANAFQRWAFQFYPDHQELFKLAERKVQELGGSTVKLEGGRKLKWLTKIVGWKLAVKLARS